MNSLPFLMNCSDLDIIVSGLSHSLLFTFCAHCTINTWLLVYFYLICRYINIKLKESNDLISKFLLKWRLFDSRRVLSFIHNLNEIYSELHEYIQDFLNPSICCRFGSFVEHELIFFLIIYCSLYRI